MDCTFRIAIRRAFIHIVLYTDYMEHGRTAYNKNICRCRLCRDAHAAYNRDQRAGRLKKVSPEEKFWARIRKDGTIPLHYPQLGRCWLWIASHNTQGYGIIGIVRDGKKTTVPVHRLVYEKLIGPIPDKLYLDHLCWNTGCCNPAHLEPVSVAENNLRGHLARKSEQCSQGHPYRGSKLFRWCEECYKIRINHLTIK